MPEIWEKVSEAPQYIVSNQGRIRNADRGGRPLIVGKVTDGSLSVVLTVDGISRPYLVRRLVAEAFVAPHNDLCDTVDHLDGNKENCFAENLVWRPRHLAWRYTRQFREDIPQEWMTPVMNVETGERFTSVISAGIRYGIVWEDLYNAVWLQRPTFPHGDHYVYI